MTEQREEDRCATPAHGTHGTPRGVLREPSAMTRHRPWRELFEKLPPEDQAAIKANTAKVLEEERRTSAGPAPRRPQEHSSAGNRAVRFGPLSELTRDLSPADRAEVERIKVDMRREGERLAAAGQVGPGTATPGAREPESAKLAVAAAANRPGIADRDGGRRGD